MKLYMLWVVFGFGAGKMPRVIGAYESEALRAKAMIAHDEKHNGALGYEETEVVLNETNTAL